MKKVSIIIPVFNCEKFLKKCLDSVLNQDYENLEIILVNDGSTDKSGLICLKYKEINNNIKYIEKRNGGASSARNIGLMQASGDYIFFLDSDDFLEKMSISTLVDNLCDGVLIGLSHSGYSYKRPFYTIEELFEGIMKNKILGSVCGYLFDKDYINDIKFNEDIFFMEDTLFLFEYLKKVEKVKYINDIKYNYVFNKNSVTNNKNISNILKNIKNYYNSINEIKKIMSKLNYDNLKINKFSSYKLIKLTESEFIKLNSIEDIKIFCDNKLIRKIILSNKINNIVLKFVCYLIKNKSVILSFLYINLRKIYIKLR